MKILAYALIFFIWVYQIISPLFYSLFYRFRPVCHFHPSCSNYAILALRKDPFFKACKKIHKRILRCRPNTPFLIDFP